MKRPMKAYSKTPELRHLPYPCLVSPKLDGIRAIVLDGVAMSNSMKPIPNKYVQRILGSMDLNGLDGELMLNGDFESIQSGIMSEHGEPDFFFNVFDDYSILGPFKERLVNATKRIYELNSAFVKEVYHYRCVCPNDVKQLWDQFVKKGYEGAMVRSLEGPYKEGRSTLKEGYLIKLKIWHDDEGEIIGFTELEHNSNEAFTGEMGQTKRSHKQEGMTGGDTLGCLILSWNGIEIEIGSGFTESQRKIIWDNQDQYLGQTVTFKYQNLTKYSKPRFPIYKGVRHD